MKFAAKPIEHYPPHLKQDSSSLNTTLIVDKHCSDVCCDEFLEPQIDRKSKYVKHGDIENFLCNQYGD